MSPSKVKALHPFADKRSSTCFVIVCDESSRMNAEDQRILAVLRTWYLIEMLSPNGLKLENERLAEEVEMLKEQLEIMQVSVGMS